MLKRVTQKSTKATCAIIGKNIAEKIPNAAINNTHKEPKKSTKIIEPKVYLTKYTYHQKRDVDY